MPEHQKVQKRSQKRQSIQDKRRNLQKESTATKEKMRKIREEIIWKEERFRLLSDKFDKNRVADAEMEAELQGLQAGEERRGSNASQTCNCCLEEAWQHLVALGGNQNGGLVTKAPKSKGCPSGWMPGREERRNSEK